MDKLIEKLIEFLPFWYVICIALIVIGMKFYYTRFRPIENKTKHADCISKNGKIDELSSDMKIVKSDIGDMKSDIMAIKSILSMKYPNVANVFSMKKSPRQLNDAGEWLYRQVGGEAFILKNKAFLFERVNSMNPKTSLDVEYAANIACNSSTDSDIFNDIKRFVYNAPSMTIKDEEYKDKKYDLTLGDVCYVLSIPLRDMYLMEHPNIS